jgi:hypothetical protein
MLELRGRLGYVGLIIRPSPPKLPALLLSYFFEKDFPTRFSNESLTCSKMNEFNLTVTLLKKIIIPDVTRHRSSSLEFYRFRFELSFDVLRFRIVGIVGHRHQCRQGGSRSHDRVRDLKKILVLIYLEETRNFCSTKNNHPLVI